MDSPNGCLQALHPLQTTFPHISLQNLFLLLPPHFFFIRQAQKFFRAGEVSWNLGNLIKNFVKNKRKNRHGRT